MTTTNFRVTGMRCAGCRRRLVEQPPSGRALTVVLGSGSLIVDGDENLDAAAVLAAVEQAGYRAVGT